MRDFDYEKLRKKRWDNEIISYIASIHEYKGKQELFARQNPVKLDRLVEIAKIQSTESSNRIEGIVTTKPRFRRLVQNNAAPKNRAEEEILGYRNALNIVHENHDNIPLTPNYILQLHMEMLKFTSASYGGKFKSASNEIAKVFPKGKTEILFRPLEPFETPNAVRQICESYNNALKKEIVDPLILISCFVLDFLCVHPFSDGNGRMSRLLTLLLLYKSGYMVGKYVSIEKAIAETKENYYGSLAASNKNWHKGKNNPKPFVQYMLAVILSCYREFEKRLDGAESGGEKITSYDIVKKYVQNKIGAFTKQEALECCPSLGRSSVEAVLKKLVEEKFVQRLGAGRMTKYVRLEKSAAKQRNVRRKK